MTQISWVFSALTSSTVAASPSPVKLLPPEGEGEVREPLQLLAVVGDLALEVEVEEEEKELLEAGGLEVETFPLYLLAFAHCTWSLHLLLH